MRHLRRLLMWFERKFLKITYSIGADYGILAWSTILVYAIETLEIEIASLRTAYRNMEKVPATYENHVSDGQWDKIMDKITELQQAIKVLEREQNNG